MVRKGLEGIIGMVLVIGMIVAAIAFSGFTHILGDGLNERVKVEIEIYSLENALRAAKLYIDEGFGFSLDQACSDVSLRGGSERNSQTEKLVSDSGDVYYTLAEVDKFLGEVESEAKRHINFYTDKDYFFLESFLVKLPEYDVVRTFDYDVDTGESILYLKGTAKDPKGLSIHSENADLNLKIDLWKEPTPRMPVVWCYSLYQKAEKMEPEVQAQLDEKMQEAIASLPAENSVIVFETSGDKVSDYQGDPAKADAIFIQEIGNSVSESVDGFGAKFSGISSNGVVAELVNARLAVSPTCTDPVYDSSADKTSFSCGFIYTASAGVKVEINGIKKHVVYDQKENKVLEKLEKLVFAVKSEH